MKVLLIKPFWKVYRQSVSPPMGILYLASYLRERMKPAPEVLLLEQAADQLSLADIETFLQREKPDIVGITAMTFEAPAVKLLADLSKRLLPETTVVVGGPHATVFYDHLLNNTRVDIAVQGEGEETFLEIVTKIRDGRDWNNIEGIAYKQNGNVIKNKERPPIMDLDSMPFPAWDLIDIPKYLKFGDMNNFLMAWPYMFIFTSRACPYGCIYCHQIFGKKFRARSVDSVIEEIRKLTGEYGVRELHIIDDIFNWDIDRAKEICRRIISEGIRVTIAFPNGIRGDRLDDELIELLAKAGCYSLTFAIETASPRLQKLLHKNADLDKLKWAINKTYDVGIIPMGFFMLGFPTETRAELEETIRFACQSKMLLAIFFTVVPFPRTGLFDLFLETYPNDFHPDDYSLDDMTYFASQPFYEKVTGIDVQAAVRSAYRRFYFNPVRLVRIVMRFPWNRRLFRGLYLGFRSVWTGGRILELIWASVVRRRLGMSSSPESRPSEKTASSDRRK